MSELYAIVVGGGLAGITAAVNLQVRGRKVLLLEGNERLGGKVKSITVGKNSFELGGGNMNPKQELLFSKIATLVGKGQLVNYPDLTAGNPNTVMVMTPDQAPSGTPPYVFTKGWMDSAGIPPNISLEESFVLIYLTAQIELMQVEVTSGSSGKWLFSKRLEAMDGKTFQDWVDENKNSFLLKNFWTPLIDGLLAASVKFIFCCETNQLNFLWFITFNALNNGYLYVEGNEYVAYTLNMGLQNFVEKNLAWPLYAHNNVKTNAKVTKIDTSDPAKVSVTYFVNGYPTTVSAPCVVVAMSPTIAGKIQYNPPLSKERNELHSQPMSKCIKSLCFYEQPWWRQTDTKYNGICGSISIIDYVQDISSQDGTQFGLMVYVIGDDTDQFQPINTKSDVLKAEIQKWLAYIFTTQVPDMIAFNVENWREEAYFTNGAGGYSTYFRKGSLLSVADLMQKPEANGRLYFAGAEYALKNVSTLEGAMQSGTFVADAITTAKDDKEKVVAISSTVSGKEEVRDTISEEKGQEMFQRFSALVPTAKNVRELTDMLKAHLPSLEGKKEAE